MKTYTYQTVTYQTVFSLEHEKAKFYSGICLSSASLDDLYHNKHSLLHPKEQNYFATLHFPKRQHSYLLGRYCAKQAISAYTEQVSTEQVSTEQVSNAQKALLSNPALICIENGIFQQPIVYHESHHNLEVSISHTENLGAALAFSLAHPMAIDIENISDTRSEAIQKQLTEPELKLSKGDIHTLTTFWTTKEALSKVLKCGFMVSFDLLEISRIEPFEHYTLSQFKNFSQYQSLSFVIAGSICSIVYPKKSKINFDISLLQAHFKGLTTPKTLSQSHRDLATT